MAIRHYRRPLPNLNYAPLDPSVPPPQPQFEDVFVVLETPLLEFTKKDLLLLRELRIDPFRD